MLKRINSWTEQAAIVRGSLSWLPRLGDYREPLDLDVDVPDPLFDRVVKKLGARVEPFRRGMIFVPRTTFLRLTVPEPLDLASYVVHRGRLCNRLAFGYGPSYPRGVWEQTEMLEWRGVRFRATPPECAYVKKALKVHVPNPMGGKSEHYDKVAAWYRGEVGESPEVKWYRRDLRALAGIVDWKLVDRIMNGIDWRCFGVRTFGPPRLRNRQALWRVLREDAATGFPHH